MRYLKKIFEVDRISGAVFVFGEEQGKRLLADKEFRKEFQDVINKSLKDIYKSEEIEVDYNNAMLMLLLNGFNWYCHKKNMDDKQITQSDPKKLFEYIWGFRNAILAQNDNPNADVQYLQKNIYRIIKGMINNNKKLYPKREKFIIDTLKKYVKIDDKSNIMYDKGDFGSSKGIDIKIRSNPNEKNVIKPNEIVQIRWYKSSVMTSMPDIEKGKTGYMAECFSGMYPIEINENIKYYLVLNLEKRKYTLYKSDRAKIYADQVYIPYKNLIPVSFSHF